MSDYSYPEELVNKTKKRIQAQLKGNGVDPQTCKIHVKRQGIGEFTARTTYKIDAKTQTKTAPGKIIEGTLVNQGELQNAVNAALQKIQNDSSIKTLVEDQIKKLPAQGFGSNKEVFSLSQTAQNFTEHKTCGTCQGKTQTNCPTCYGKKRIKCNICYASGYQRCTACQGRGTVQNSNGQQIACPTCRGKRQILCPNCRGQQFINCNSCRATGIVTCRSCNGAGASSQITTVEAVAMTQSIINIQELDHEPKRLASIVSPEKLAAGDHVQIIINQKSSENDDTNKIPGIHYTIKMPWAAGDVLIHKKSYSIGFVGKKGAIAESKNFMNDILKKPRSLMNKAAKGQGFVVGLLTEACDFRVSRETLAAVAKGQKKRAMQTLMKNYGVGLSKNAIKSFVLDAHNALKRTTRRPRYIGLILGLMISAGLYYFWFQMGGRLNTVHQPEKIRYAIDFIIFIVGSVLSRGCIKTAGYFVLQSVMKEIGLPIKKIPAAGVAGIYAILGNLILWGGMFGLLFFG